MHEAAYSTSTLIVAALGMDLGSLWWLVHLLPAHPARNYWAHVQTQSSKTKQMGSNIIFKTWRVCVFIFYENMINLFSVRSWGAGQTAPQRSCLSSRSSWTTTSGSVCTGMGNSFQMLQFHWCNNLDWKLNCVDGKLYNQQDVTDAFAAVTPMGECRSLPADTLSTSSSSQLLQNGGHGSAALRCSPLPSHVHCKNKQT